MPDPTRCSEFLLASVENLQPSFSSSGVINTQCLLESGLQSILLHCCFWTGQKEGFPITLPTSISKYLLVDGVEQTGVLMAQLFLVPLHVLSLSPSVSERSRKKLKMVKF